MSISAPFGSLASFGGWDFDPLNTTPVRKGSFERILSLDYASGDFPVDKRGTAPSPRKDTEWEWELILVAQDGLDSGAAYQDLEGQFGDIAAALDGTYSNFGTGGIAVSGQVGWLQVYTADQNGLMQCWARFKAISFGIAPGDVYAYVCTLTFVLLSPW